MAETIIHCDAIYINAGSVNFIAQDSGTVSTDGICFGKQHYIDLSDRVGFAVVGRSRIGEEN